MYLRGNLRVRLAAQRSTQIQLATTCRTVWPGLKTCLKFVSSDCKLKSQSELLRNGHKLYTFFAENISKTKETDEQTEDLTGYILLVCVSFWMLKLVSCKLLSDLTRVKHFDIDRYVEREENKFSRHSHNNTVTLNPLLLSFWLLSALRNSYSAK